METATTRPSRPTTVADYHRLAALGRDRGLTLFQEAGSGAWFCTSATDRFRLYYVTALSCTCEGFLRHQRCSHNSLLLSELGWLPPEPEPPAVVTCPECCGGGILYVADCAGFPYPACHRCAGSGQAAVPLAA